MSGFIGSGAADRSPLNFLWFIPSGGDNRRLAWPEGERAPDPEYLRQVAVAADKLGYYGVLMPTGAMCADAWITAASIAPFTERLKLLVALRPGLTAPAEAVRQAAALDRLSNGRALLNVVTGGSPKALAQDGIFLDHTQRYQQTAEFLDTTPFQWMKQVASHFGGTRNPLIVSWPGHTGAPGAVRSQFGHVNDIVPTILDAAGIAFPENVDGVQQQPFEGHSLVPSFTDAKAPEAHREQYFEIFGNRAIYKDGWVAAAKRPYLPWKLIESGLSIYSSDPATDRWELYHVDQDFSEATDLAAKEPAKLAELKAEFEKEGLRNGVFPLLPVPFGGPSLLDPKAKSFRYRPDIGQLPRNAVPDLSGRAHRFEVDIAGDAAAGSGVLLAEGGRLGGFALYVKAGHLVFENNAFGQSRQTVASSEVLPKGPLTVAYEYVPDQPAESGPFNPAVPGTVTLFVDGRQVASSPIGKFLSANGAYWEGFDVGVDRGSPVSADPVGQVRYSQPLGEVRLELK